MKVFNTTKAYDILLTNNYVKANSDQQGIYILHYVRPERTREIMKILLPIKKNSKILIIYTCPEKILSYQSQMRLSPRKYFLHFLK